MSRKILYNPQILIMFLVFGACSAIKPVSRDVGGAGIPDIAILDFSSQLEDVTESFENLDIHNFVGYDTPASANGKDFHEKTKKNGDDAFVYTRSPECYSDEDCSLETSCINGFCEEVEGLERAYMIDRAVDSLPGDIESQPFEYNPDDYNTAFKICSLPPKTSGYLIPLEDYEEFVEGNEVESETGFSSEFRNFSKDYKKIERTPSIIEVDIRTYKIVLKWKVWVETRTIKPMEDIIKNILIIFEDYEL